MNDWRTFLTIEEGLPGSCHREVDQIVGNQQCARREQQSQPADCRCRDRCPDPQLRQRRDISAVVDAVRRDAMPAPMPRQKRDRSPADRTQAHQRLTPRRCDLPHFWLAIHREIPDAGSADQGDQGRRQASRRSWNNAVER